MVLLPLNFASEPFRRDRAMLAASTAVGLLLIALLSVLVNLAAAERARSAENRQALVLLEKQLASAASQQAQIETTLRQDANAEVFERSQFLNLLLYRKGISWTRVFSDLEGVLPHNVRLVSIRPQVSARNDVLLDMVVSAQASEPVIDFLMQLEASPLFGATNIHSLLPPSQSEPMYRCRVSVNYVQKL
jgi:Tfp pilus assembly protein PilN